LRAALKRSDKAVLEYLRELAQTADGETCTASIPNIAGGSGVLARQVQISTRRLIEAGLLRRVGYDFSNPDLTKRGTIYEVTSDDEMTLREVKEGRKKSVKFLLFWSED
jgi:hypothetical protein